MKIFRKDGGLLQILAFPSDVQVQKGDYLIARDDGNKSALMQVIDVNYANTPGILEDLLRSMSTEKVVVDTHTDPVNISSLTLLVKEARVIVAKIRGVVQGSIISHSSTWLPSRFNTLIHKAKNSLLLKLAGIEGVHPVALGELADDEFWIDAESLDGRLTIITGKKETGKSHAAKLISLALLSHGALIVVLDVNGEYVGLGRNSKGEPNEFHDRVKVLEVGRNFRITAEEAGLKVMRDVLSHVFGTPATSCREFARIWVKLRKQRIPITLDSLTHAVQKANMHESVKEALMSRLSALESMSFFTHRDKDARRLSNDLDRTEEGCLLVVNMRNLFTSTRKVVVEYLLSKLGTLLGDERIPPIFLVAEEAHLYLRDTYWDDLITRMRHYGLFPVFVTNQPDTIPEMVYRQADNIFLFNFTNELDLEAISRASRADAQSVRMIASQLPVRHCLLLGHAVRDLPMVIKVRGLDVDAMGATRLFFGEERGFREQTAWIPT